MNAPVDDANLSPSARRRGVRRGAAVVGVLALALAVPAVTTSQQASAASLTPFGSCEEVDEWFTSAARDMVGPWGLQPGGDDGGWWSSLTGRSGSDSVAMGAPESASAEAVAGAATDLSTGGAVGNGSTGTNVQEAGVDEPDLVKTDGSTLLTVSGGTLHVVDVTGTQPRRLAELQLPQQWAGELLLLGDRALVIGQGDTAFSSTTGAVTGDAGTTVGPSSPDAPLFGADEPVTGPAPEPLPETLPAPRPELMPSPLPEPLPSPVAATTVLSVVDLSDTSAPSLVRSEEIEAGYLSAREHDGSVRIVLASRPTPNFEQPEYDENGQVLDEDAATDRNLEILQDVAPQEWLPHRVVRDGDGQVTDRVAAVDCQAVSHPSNASGLGVLTVLTLDATAPDVPTVDTDAVSADGDLVYASTDRLYVATTAGGWGFPMPIDDGLFGSTVGRMAGPSSAGTTQLHGFDTGSGTATEYVASGSVDGWLLGRWAMSAQDGMLRVATTRDGTSQSGTDAAVTVLSERDGALEQVGQVGGLGQGEQIRAVRWFGDLAVVVTFRQTDPLYTVDLSDPAAPRVVGELKIPGYSAYLHPIGDGMLLGVGQDADPETGMTLGAQVATFDLTDLAAPTQVDTLVYPNGYTEVEGDSRQFSYSPDLRQAVLPVSGERGSSLATIHVETDGTLAEIGSWQVGREAWLVRTVPVDGDRWAAVSEGANGPVVTLLDSDLDVVGDLTLG